MTTTTTTTIISISARFRKLFKIVEFVCQCCGSNIFKENYRMNWLTYLGISVIIGFFVSIFYTIYEAVAIANDLIILLQIMCFFGTGVQGVTKFTSAIYNAKKLRFLHDELDNIYKQFECEHAEYQRQLRRSLALAKRIIYVLIVVYAINPIGVLSIPQYYRFFRNERMPIMHLNIPAIDHATDWGFYVTHIYHINCVFFSSFGSFASDIICFLIVAHILLLKNILKCKFDDLDEVLRLYPEDKTKSGPLLRDIFQWHQKYLVFSDTVKQSFFWVIFVQITTATIGIICTMVCLFLGVWPSAPVFLIYSIVVLYIYCGLGNLVDISNDEVTTIIYDCMWYELPVPQQKMLLTMMRESQMTEGITIGGIFPLSMNTALQLTKSIYTVAMLLNENVN